MTEEQNAWSETPSQGRVCTAIPETEAFLPRTTSNPLSTVPMSLNPSFLANFSTSQSPSLPESSEIGIASPPPSDAWVSPSATSSWLLYPSSVSSGSFESSSNMSASSAHYQSGVLSQRFLEMLCAIGNCLPFSSTKKALHKLLQSIGVDLAIGEDISTVPALFQHLHGLRIIHECEVDLLCALLKKMEQHKLHGVVLNYAQGIMGSGVDGYSGVSIEAQNPTHFLVSTTHSRPFLTYASMCGVKDVFANLLGVDRHAFWLYTAECGDTTTLGWGFGKGLSEPIRRKLESDSFQRESATIPDLININIGCPGDIPPRSAIYSNPQSNPVSYMSKESEEEATSTCPPPQPMEVGHPPHTQGTKRKHSATYELEDKDYTPTTSSGNRKYDEAAVSAPAPKRMARTRDSTLAGMTSGQFSQQHITESYQYQTSAGESIYRRALREHQSLIVDNLNLMSILPHLSLLTDNERQTMLLSSLTDNEKIMRLVSMIERKGEQGFHIFLAALEAASEHISHRRIAEALRKYTNCPPKPPPATLKEMFADNLCSFYSGDQFFQATNGPGIRDVKFIRLALIKNKGVSEADKSSDKFLKATLHGHIEDIVKKKKRLEMENIFSYKVKGSRKLVLVEGAPGVGKTMLAMKLCQQWAKKEALQEYDLVLFVELRQYQKHDKLNLETLLEAYLEDDPAMITEIKQILVRTGGNKLLIILEGWDELSPALRSPYSWFTDLIRGKKLPNADMMVTSRPSVTAPLYDYMDDRRIEVLGFDSQQQDEYIGTNTTDPEVAQRIRNHLKQFPNLRALAHIPLTLSIICHVASNSSSLPVTLTELYDQYICTFLLHAFRKSSQPMLSSLIGLESLDEMPDEARKVFEGLCRLALGRFEEKAFIFEKSDLEQYGLAFSGNFDGHGLLTTRTVLAKAGRKVLYQFRHLSIQEFLAGLQINRQPPGERSRLLVKYRDDKQFRNVWKFLSGVSRLQDEAFCQELVQPIRKSSRDQLFLLHCLYEAQNPAVCHIAADKMEHTLHLDNTTLNATDCLCAAYVVGMAEGDWEVNLRGCNIGGDGLEVLKWQLMEHDSPNLKIIYLNLTHNQLDTNDMSHLAEMFTQMKTRIIRVEVESNKIQDDGAKVLAEALRDPNSSVQHMHFRECRLSSESARWLADALKCNPALKDLYLGFENIGDMGAEYLASALPQNNVLEELGLAKVGLTVAALRSLRDGLKSNHKLKTLRIDRNQFHASDCQVIAEMIKTNNSLEHIDLSRNPIGDNGFSMILNALLEKPDGLHKIGIYGCEITSREMHKFVELFRKTNVFKGMHIGLNNFGDQGAKWIAEALKENKSESVKDIYMDNTGLSEAGKQMMMEVAAMREDLTVSYEVNASVLKGRQRMKEEMRSS